MIVRQQAREPEMAIPPVQAAMKAAMHDPHAAAQYLKDPVAYWHSVGGTLPPGVSTTQFSQRVTSSALHQTVVNVTTHPGQITVLSSCQSCLAFVGFLVDLVGGGAALLTPGVGEWVAAAAGITLAGVVTAAEGVSSAISVTICHSMGQC
jgi:hypothetical protein